MAKKITYQVLFTAINHGTNEEPDIEQIFIDRVAICPTEAAFNEMMPIAEKEAVPGTIEVTGEFDPEPEPVETTDDVLNALLGVPEW